MHAEDKGTRIEAFFPNYYEDVWVGHSCKAILDGMQFAKADTQLSVLACAKNSEEKNIHPLLPRKLTRLLALPGCDAVAKSMLARRFERRLGRDIISYLWLSSPVELVQNARSRGSFVVREMINCSAQMRQRELDRAHDLLGWPNLTTIRDSEIERERKELLACDAVFCPNPMVRQSAREYGVKDDACIDCSYGWSEGRFTPHAHNPIPHDGINVVFAGTIDVRKGVPWLLQAWAQSKIAGTLYLAGRVDDQLSQLGASWLNQSSVKLLGHVKDISSVYNRADIFVFPSWEEGGPMVTLEAMAHGLPCVVTPMGTSGAVTKDEGVVVEAGSVEALTEALVRLANDADLRRQLGNAAFEKSLHYTWSRVGALRLERLNKTKAWLESQRT